MFDDEEEKEFTSGLSLRQKTAIFFGLIVIISIVGYLIFAEFPQIADEEETPQPTESAP
ncbi:MAG TPA: hypothetical protein VF411_07645 [Bacteroidia bacterium]